MTLFIRGPKIRVVGEEEGGAERAEKKWAEKSERNGNEECKSAKTSDFREASMSASTSTSTTIAIHPAPRHAAPPRPVNG